MCCCSQGGKIMTKILLSITKKKHEEVENMMRDTPLSFQTSVAASLGSRWQTCTHWCPHHQLQGRSRTIITGRKTHRWSHSEAWLIIWLCRHSCSLIPSVIQVLCQNISTTHSMWKIDLFQRMESPWGWKSKSRRMDFKSLDALYAWAPSC